MDLVLHYLFDLIFLSSPAHLPLTHLKYIFLISLTYIFAQISFQETYAAWTVVLEKTLESPLDCKKMQPVHPKGAQSWVFIGRSDAEDDTPILWPPHAKSWLIGKDPDAWRDWGWEEKGMTGWDGWMASPTLLTRVRVNSGSWWWTGRPGMLWFMGSQRVGHNWGNELNWTELMLLSYLKICK